MLFKSHGNFHTIFNKIISSHAIAIYLVEKYAKDNYLYPKNDLRLRSVINDRLFFDASFLFPRGLGIFVIYNLVLNS